MLWTLETGLTKELALNVLRWSFF